MNDRDLAVMRVFADLIAAQIDRELEHDRRHAAMRARLCDAMAGNGLSMVFQPIADVETGEPTGFEALARFEQTPVRGPDVWFAEAAEVGLRVDLELAAIRLALHHLPELPPRAYLAVNVSPSTAISGCLDGALGDVPVNRIVLEITEHDVIEAYEELEAALSGLRRRGARVAVDDAGAGYASFRHILRLKPDIIKLDTALTRDIDRDRSRRALASALIAFGHDTGSAIVAEGVETAAELQTLRCLGVSAAQGYFLGRPGPLLSSDQQDALTRT